MSRIAKSLLLIGIVGLTLLGSGCVYYPARPYHPYAAAWVPGHWAGPRGDLWIEGRYR